MAQPLPTHSRAGCNAGASLRAHEQQDRAEEENGQSRIYLGIHWAFDKTEGITQGRRVADYVLKNLFTPVHEGRR
jgi:hypothetical protein